MIVPSADDGGSGTAEIPPAPPISSTGSFQAEHKPAIINAVNHPLYASHIPLSHRWASPLDMSTVERKGQSFAARESCKRVRPHGIREAPTFCPTEEEFKDPFAYVQKIRVEGEKYGICKIIPPNSWNPDFSINTERFFFKTRRQELNSVEGSTRTNLQYLDQLAKFHKQHGMSLNRFPSVDKRPLDLYKLKKAVEIRGGFEKVCKGKKWAEIGRDLGYSGKIMSSLSTSLKNSYQKWLHPYEEYLKIAKPGVQQQLEYENGGPFTPTLVNRGKEAQHDIRASVQADSPAMRATVALNASINDVQNVSDRTVPILESPTYGFTAVNTISTGWAAVNKAAPAFHPVASATLGPKGDMKDDSSSSHVIRSPTSQSEALSPSIETQDHINAAAPAIQYENPLKRALSTEDNNGASSSEPSADGDDQAERRSKRFKKGMITIVAAWGMLVSPACFDPHMKFPG